MVLANILNLLQNVALLLALLLVFELLTAQSRMDRSSLRWELASGVILAFIALSIMATGIEYSGFRFDARSILLGIVGLFFGWIPLLIAASASLLYRVFVIGGAGTIVGSATILTSGLIGLLGREWIKGDIGRLNWKLLLTIGLLIHLVMFLLLATLQVDSFFGLFKVTGLTTLVVYPLAFLAIGLILCHRHRFNLNLKALSESEARNRHLNLAIEQSPATVVLTDTEGTIEYVNAKFCEVTGYSREEAIGQNPRLLKSGNLSHDHYRALWASLKRGEPWRGEFHNRRKDGSLFWESAFLSPLCNEKGEITHFLAIKEDITQLKEQAKALEVAQDQAEKASRAKSEFLGLISHELRTPLNQIIGPCELAIESIEDAEIKGLLENAQDAADHLLQMVDRILKFSELDLENQDFEPIQIHLEPFLKTAVKGFAAAAQNRGMEIGVTCSEDSPSHIQFDAAYLMRILHILLENELKFALPGPILVGTEMSPEGLVLFVEDRGPGIPEKVQKEIFEPFRQIEMGYRRGHEGIGLGLAMAYRLAKLSGGDMRVESEIGKGSRFLFTFPSSVISIDAAGDKMHPRAPLYQTSV